MTHRILLTLLSALVAPLGASPELSGAEAEARVEAAVEWAGGVAEAGPGLTAGTSEQGSGGPQGSFPAFRPAFPGFPRAATASSVGVRTCAAHLSRCGHDAAHLDLPPPSLA